MKKIVILLIGLLWSTVAVGTVSMRLCEADGNTPFDSNTPIMVGTKLTVYVDSNSAAADWVGGIDLIKPVPDPNIPIGKLFGRGWDPNALDYVDSRFSAAGIRAKSVEWENQDQQSFELAAGDANMATGTWFVLDYNAMSVGDYTVRLVEYQGNQIVVVASKTIQQVATRDFNGDGYVDFVDFARLASYWLRTDCNGLNHCEGSDLNPVPDGQIDFLDMMYFADFWLCGFRQPNSAGDANMPPSGPPVVYLTYDGNTPPDPNTDLTIHVYSDVLLSSMEVGIEISGDAIITGAMDVNDCDQYGWNPGWWSSSEIDPNGTWASTGNIAQTGGTSGTVGYFTLHYNSGQVNITITTSSSIYDVNSQSVIYSTDPLILGGENQQQSMMQRSSSFQLESSSSLDQQPVASSEQQIVDVNDLVNWCEDLWNNDAEFRATTTEADWNAFIESIRTSP